MKQITFKKLAVALVVLFAFSISAISCSKSVATPGDNGNNNGGNTGDVHIIDAKLVGKWMWTEGSDVAYYDDNGVYTGSAYGFAMEYTIGADGYGTCFNHIYSTLGTGTGLEVNISYKGFFESDNEGHMGFFPTSGTYKSTSGENRNLRPDELWNTQTKTGRNFLYQYAVTTQGGRECFNVTASNGVVDTFFKLQ